jgi:hypothetical protein
MSRGWRHTSDPAQVALILLNQPIDQGRLSRRCFRNHSPPTEESQQSPERRPVVPRVRRRWPWAATVRQVPTHESLDHSLVDLRPSHPPRCQPAAEMLDDLRVGLNAGQRVPARVQIEDKVVKNYAEMAGSHPPTNHCVSENLFDHGEPCEPQRFARLRHLS